MKKHLVLFIFLYFFFEKSIFATVENKILIKVSSETITNFDVKQKILTSLIISNQPINQKNIDALKSQTIENLINLNLKKTELKKYSIKVDDLQINNYLNLISSNNIINLKEKFKSNEIDYDVFLDEILVELKWQKLVFGKFKDRISIDEKTINGELSKIINEQNTTLEYKIAEIEILSGDQNENKKKIIEIKKQINELGFEETALTYSISTSATNKGDLGWVNSNSLSNNFNKIISKMKIGEVSEAVYNQNTIVFYKLLDQRYLKNENINKNKIKERLVNQKKNELLNLYSKSYLSKLKNTTFIEFK